MIKILLLIKKKIKWLKIQHFWYVLVQTIKKNIVLF